VNYDSTCPTVYMDMNKMAGSCHICGQDTRNLGFGYGYADHEAAID